MHLEVVSAFVWSMVMFDGDVQYYGHIRVSFLGSLNYEQSLFISSYMEWTARKYRLIYMTQIDCLGGGGGGEGGRDGDNGNVWGIRGDPGWSSHWKSFYYYYFFLAINRVKVHAHILSQIFQSLTSPPPLMPIHIHFLHSFSFNLIQVPQ